MKTNLLRNIYIKKNETKLKIINSNNDKFLNIVLINNLKYLKKMYIKNYSKKCGLNEIKAYNINIKKKYYLIPEIYFSKLIKNKLVVYEEYIDAKPSNMNYFFLKNFLNFKKFKLDIKQINLENYLKKINPYKKQGYNFFKKKFYFYNNKFFVNFSHGDFIHYNTIIDGKKFYTLDFEYFNSQRSYMHDIINWIIFPIISNIRKFRLYYLSKLSSKLIIVLFNILLKKKFKEFYIKDIDFYFKIYLFEKLYFLKNDLKLNKNIKKGEKEKKLIYIKLINNLIHFQNENFDNNALI